jgi:hypothetical protein
MTMSGPFGFGGDSQAAMRDIETLGRGVSFRAILSIGRYPFRTNTLRAPGHHPLDESDGEIAPAGAFAAPAQRAHGGAEGI